MKANLPRDELLHVLSDARLRAHPSKSWLLPPEKTGRMARLWARRYYRGCLGRSFQHTQTFATATGRGAADILDSAQFAGFVDECVLGAFDSARRVGEMARVHLDGAAHPGAWWRDLVAYEYFWFLQEATTESAARIRRHQRGVSAVCQTFAWLVSRILERLRAGEAVPNDLHQECTLLFSRGADGRVVVVEMERDAAAVFRATNGYRTVEQVATAAAVPQDLAATVLEQLEEIGAIVPPA